MSDLRERIIVEAEGLTVSKIVWRRFHRPMPGLVERIFNENQGLSERGVILPLGTVFFIPVEKERPADQSRVVRLW